MVMLSHRDSFIQHKCSCTSVWAVDGWAVGQLVIDWISEFKEKRVVVCVLPEDQLVTRGVSQGVLPWDLCLSVTWQKRSIHFNKSADYTSLLEQPIDLKVGLPIFLEGYWEDVSWWESKRQQTNRTRKAQT